MIAIDKEFDKHIDSALVEYNFTDAVLEKLRSEYMTLRIDGINDVEGFKKVHAARMDVKKKRVQLEKARKEWKADILKAGRIIDEKCKHVFSKLAPIEEHLLSQEKAVEEEKRRIREEAERREQERIARRVQSLYDLGMLFDGFGYVYHSLHGGDDIRLTSEELKAMQDEAFRNFLESLRGHVQREAEKQAEIERRKKEEEERLARIRAEQEAEARRLAEERERLRKEQEEIERKRRKEEERIAAERRRIEEEKRLEQARKEAEERAKREAEERAKREAEEKAERERIAHMEAELKEKMRPDNEKLIAYAKQIEAIPTPELKYEQSYEILKKADGHIRRAIQILKETI